VVGYGGAIMQSGQFSEPVLKFGVTTLLPDGTVVLTVSGDSGQVWEIQRTSDLLRWDQLRRPPDHRHEPGNP